MKFNCKNAQWSKVKNVRLTWLVYYSSTSMMNEEISKDRQANAPFERKAADGGKDTWRNCVTVAACRELFCCQISECALLTVGVLSSLHRLPWSSPSVQRLMESLNSFSSLLPHTCMSSRWTLIPQFIRLDPSVWNSCMKQHASRILAAWASINWKVFSEQNKADCGASPCLIVYM